METIGMIFSIIAMTISIISYQLKNKKTLLFLQSITTLLFLVSYAFSVDGGFAVYLNIVFFSRNIYFYFFENNKKRIKQGCYVSLVLIYLTYILYTIIKNPDTVNNIWNLVPVIGATLHTIGLSQSNDKTLRLWKIGDSICWIGFNIFVGLSALGGTIGESLVLISCLIYLFKEIMKKHSK